MTLAPEGVEHVHRLAPNARIILMMRNPIERAWSGSVMAKRDIPLSEVKTSAATAIESQRSRMLTDYLTALDRWTAYYPAERIFIGFMEDVARQPRLLLSAICRFLGVSPSEAFRRAGQVVHRGKASAMPAVVAARLAGLYGPLARELSHRFGGYAEFWAHCADRVEAWAGDREEVPYPFWQTELWEEWTSAGGHPPEGIQSGPLAEVPGAR
jgi:hypothetical protein